MGGSRQILNPNAVFNYNWDPHDATGGGNPVIKAMAYGSGVGALPAWEYDRGRRAGLSNTDQFEAVSTGGLTFNQSLAKARAKQAAASARLNEEQKQKRISDNLTLLNDNYGVGDTAEAQHNHGVIDDWLAGFQGDVLAEGGTNLAHQKADNDLATRQRLASQGLLGGSVDVAARRKALSSYVAGRQQVVANASSARQGVANQLEGQRSNIAQSISSGATANPDWQHIFSEEDRTLGSAKANLVPTAIGNTLGTAGDLYQQNQVAVGSGGSGFSWGRGSSSGDSTGRIT